MITQAQQALANFVSIAQIDAKDYSNDTLNGVTVDGPALIAESEILFSDAQWDHVQSKIIFADGSAIEFQRNPSSMHTTYKAV